VQANEGERNTRHSSAGRPVLRKAMARPSWQQVLKRNEAGQVPSRSLNCLPGYPLRL